MDTVPTPTDDPHAWMSLSERERMQLHMRTVAQRLGWPDGIVEQLVALENDFPAWTTWYGSEMFTARLVDPPWRQDPKLHGATIDELRGRIAAAEPRRITGWAD